MKKINFPLLIGSIIIIIILLASYYPEIFTDSDPYGSQRLEYNSEAGNLLAPPFPPSEEYPWGSDFGGRDLKSLIFYGCKATMMIVLFVALGRLLISLPIAISAAYGSKLARWVIKQFNIIFSAIPLVLFVMLLSGIKLLSDIFGSGRAVFVFLLILIGWSRFAHMLSAKIKEVLEQEFIEGEYAIGKNNWEIAIQNILPHIIPSIIVMFFIEMATVLLNITLIGAFGIILGGGLESHMENASFAYDFDWSSLLFNANYIFTTGVNLWMLYYPAIAFAISIVGMNLFAEGLRTEFEKRDSSVITFIRRIPTLISPLRYIHEIKNIQTYRKTVYVKSSIVALLLIILFFPQKSSAYRFDSINAFNAIDELSGEKYHGRLAGSEYNKLTVDYIAEQLSNYGIQPYNGSYLHSFDIENVSNIIHSEMIIQGEESEAISLEFRKDYIVTSDVTESGTYDLHILTYEDMEALQRNKLKGLENKILVFDVRMMSEEGIRWFSNSISNNVKPRGMIFIESWFSLNEKKKTSRKNRLFSDVICISVSSNSGDQILKLKNASLELEIEEDTTQTAFGYNVVGFIEGSDESKKDEYIVISSSLDYIGDDKTIRYPGAISIGGAALELEIARTFAENNIKPKMNVMFVFWDGTYLTQKGSTSFAMSNFRDLSKKYFSLDLRNFINDDTKKIIVDTSNVTPRDKAAQSYIKEIKKSADRNDINLSFGKIFSPVTEDLNYHNKTIVIIDSDGAEEVLKTTNETKELVNMKKLGKVGQMILDALVAITGTER